MKIFLMSAFIKIILTVLIGLLAHPQESFLRLLHPLCPILHARSLDQFLFQPIRDGAAQKGVVTEIKSAFDVHKITHGRFPLELPRAAAWIPPIFTDEEAPDDSNVKYVAVMFYASWCPSCHHVAPHWTMVAERLECHDGIRFFGFECDEWQNRDPSEADVTKYALNPALRQQPSALCGQFRIAAFPTLMIFEYPQTFSEGDRPSSDRLRVFTHSLEAYDTIQILSDIKEITKLPACGVSDSPLSLDDSLLEAGITLDRWKSQSLALTPDIRLHDALVALHFMLSHWVPFGSRIDDDKMRQTDLILLNKFLAALIVTIPGQNLRYDLIRLSLLISGHTNPGDSLLGISEYQAVVQTMYFGGVTGSTNDTNVISYHEDNSTQGDSPLQTMQNKFLGCPTTLCAVWTLFHMITVSLERTAIARAPWLGKGLLSNSDTDASLGIANTNNNNNNNDNISTTTKSSTTSNDNNANLATVTAAAEGEASGTDRINVALQAAEAMSLNITATGVMTVLHDIVYKFVMCSKCQIHFHAAYEGCLYKRCDWVTDKVQEYDSEAGMVSSESGSLSFWTSNNSSVAGDAFENHLNYGGTDMMNANEMPSYQGLVMWLWRLHNGVTLRTAAESTHRLQVGPATSSDSNYLGVDVLFPTESQCPTCRAHTDKPKPVVTQEMTTHGTEDIGDVLSEEIWDSYADRFNFFETHRFLHEFYWNEQWDTLTAFMSHVSRTTKAPLDLVVTNPSHYWRPRTQQFVVGHLKWRSQSNVLRRMWMAVKRFFVGDSGDCASSGYGSPSCSQAGGYYKSRRHMQNNTDKKNRKNNNNVLVIKNVNNNNNNDNTADSAHKLGLELNAEGNDEGTKSSVGPIQVLSHPEYVLLDMGVHNKSNIINQGLPLEIHHRYLRCMGVLTVVGILILVWCSSQFRKRLGAVIRIVRAWMGGGKKWSRFKYSAVSDAGRSDDNIGGRDRDRGDSLSSVSYGDGHC